MGNYNQVYMSDGPLYSHNEVKTIVNIFESSNTKVEEPQNKKAFNKGNKKSKVSCVIWEELKEYLIKISILMMVKEISLVSTI